MKKIQYSLSLLLVISLLMMGVPVLAENQTELTLTAKAAILMDSSTGQVLYAKNPDEHLQIASVTKTMTMLLTMEAIYSGRLNMDDMVSTSEYAASMGGSQVFLSPGEQMTVNDMLKAVAVASGNDAAVALAEHISGSESAFVTAMNEKAQSLGCVNTHFSNCNGLDTKDHYSSAHDIAVISRELTKYSKIFDYTSIWIDSLRNGQFGLSNTNKLIRFYNGANGLKTGSTSEALFCLSATAKRGDMQLIAVVLGAPTSKDRFNDAKILLDYGFASYSVEKFLTKGEELGEVKIDKGQKPSVKAISGSDYAVLISKNKKAAITKEVILDESVKAPVNEGQKIGEVIIRANDKEIDRMPINAAENVKTLGYIGTFSKMFKAFSHKF